MSNVRQVSNFNQFFNLNFVWSVTFCDIIFVSCQWNVIFEPAKVSLNIIQFSAKKLKLFSHLEQKKGFFKIPRSQVQQRTIFLKNHFWESQFFNFFSFHHNCSYMQSVWFTMYTHTLYLSLFLSKSGTSKAPTLAEGGGSWCTQV